MYKYVSIFVVRLNVKNVCPFIGENKNMSAPSVFEVAQFEAEEGTWFPAKAYRFVSQRVSRKNKQAGIAPRESAHIRHARTSKKETTIELQSASRRRCPAVQNESSGNTVFAKGTLASRRMTRAKLK